jgi:hypothetical protein
MSQEKFKFMNLTPHEITIVDSKGKRFDIVSHGVARTTILEEECESIGDIPVISSPSNGVLVGLPDPISGVIFIVSREVLAHPDVEGRKDVFAPATRPRHGPFHDEFGRVIGVTRLVAAPVPTMTLIQGFER